MIDKNTRNKIISLLYGALDGVPVIPDDEDTNIPEQYPYVTYSITTHTRTIGHDNYIYKQIPDGVREQRGVLNEPSFSFNVYSDKQDEIMDICYAIAEYFRRTGRFQLADEGITVVEIGNAQNRSTLLVDHLVKRWGLDVRFRHYYMTEQDMDSIESVEIENTGG